MAVNFTCEQKNAINCRGGSLIVSAAAGSGKTAVLVERVMKMLVEENVSIKDLVIVTFTEAAAGEMKHRIIQALLDRLSADPQNRQLRRQLTLVPTARIQTIHGFCSRIIRDNFNVCGISPDFSIVDKAQKEQMQEDIMEELLDERYKNYGEDKAFVALFENYGDTRGDRKIEAMVLELYEKLRSHPSPDQWCNYVIESSKNKENIDPLEQVWGRFLWDTARDIHTQAHNWLKVAYEQMVEVPEVLEKYGGCYSGMLEYAKTLDAAFEQGWDTLWGVLRAYNKSDYKLGSSRYQDKQFTGKMKTVREQYNLAIERISKNYIAVSAQRLKEENATTAPIVQGVCQLVLDFSHRFSKAKSERNLLDYSDLEHYALNILVDENGERTKLAEKISKGIHEILVDEFQDTNRVQDSIFTSVRPLSGRSFYVGDIKQSIYKFRLAEPEIFIEKYKTSAPHSPGATGVPQRIDLNKNFRSKVQVLDAINFVFSRVMTDKFGGISYDQDQALHQGATYIEDTKSEFVLIDMKNDSSDDSKIEVEARYVAHRINQLLGTYMVEEKGDLRAARATDFAILLSSYANKAGYFEKALLEYGIPSAALKSQNSFLESVEISCIMAYLRVIDNSLQDIPMVAVMRSPMYMFTPDELVEVAILGGRRCMYDGLVAYSESGHEKSTRLLEDIVSYRRMSAQVSVAQLIDTIYSEKNLLWIFGGYKNGENRRTNMVTLSKIAQGYEKQKSGGLFRFLNYVDRKYGKSGSDDGQMMGEGVQIMSIHKSKGLEFPVVFLPDLSKSFNKEDLKKSILFHQDLQVGVKYKSLTSKTTYNSQMYYALREKLQREIAEEELRKLYVAMTRAREKLVMVAAAPNGVTRVEKWKDAVALGFTPQAMAQADSYAYWLGCAYVTHPSGKGLRGVSDGVVPVADSGQDMVIEMVAADQVPYAKDKGQAEEQVVDHGIMPVPADINWEYGYSGMLNVPSKMSPTGLKQLLGKDRPARPTLGKAKAFEKGNAIHKCMELLDFSRCFQRDMLENEVHRVVTDEKERSMIDTDKLWSFFSGTCGQLIRSADKVERERQFAALFTPREVLGSGVDYDKVVINGVIDLLIFFKDHMVIVDYKSDYIGDSDPASCAEKHKMQLDIYSRGAEKMFGMPVKARYIFFTTPGKCVEV